MTCAVHSFSAYIWCEDANSIQMTELSKVAQFHGVLFIAFFNVFFLKTHSVGTLWYFDLERKCHSTVTSSSLTTANNLIWNLLALSFQTVYVCKIPPRGGGGSLAGPRTVRIGLGS